MDTQDADEQTHLLGANSDVDRKSSCFGRRLKTVVAATGVVVILGVAAVAAGENICS